MFRMLLPLISVLPQETVDGNWLAGAMATTFSVLVFVLALVLVIIGWWRVFAKAGEAGWQSLIPIYNVYVLLKIVGRPWWWLLLMLIPFINLVVWLLVCVDVARSFGKGVFMWGVILLFLFSGIGFIILGWSNAEYQGPSAGVPDPA